MTNKLEAASDRTQKKERSTPRDSLLLPDPSCVRERANRIHSYQLTSILQLTMTTHLPPLITAPTRCTILLLAGSQLPLIYSSVRDYPFCSGQTTAAALPETDSHSLKSPLLTWFDLKLARISPSFKGYQCIQPLQPSLPSHPLTFPLVSVLVLCSVVGGGRPFRVQLAGGLCGDVCRGGCTDRLHAVQEQDAQQ